MNLLTAADTTYYARLVNMIASVDKHCQNWRLSVYDLGLTRDNLLFISRIPGVTIKQVEQVNPHITKPYLKHKHHTSMVIGCYTFKPVVVKQELDEYDEVFFLDAGLTVLKNLQPLCEHTKITGCFFAGINDIGWQCTKYTAETLGLNPEFLQKQALCSAYMGFTRAKCSAMVQDGYNAAKDINLFFDDGTAGGGILAGRQDQTIFSIFAQAHRLDIHPNMNHMLLHTSNFGVEVNITDIKPNINERTIIYHSRGDADYMGSYNYLKQKYGI